MEIFWFTFRNVDLHLVLERNFENSVGIESEDKSINIIPLEMLLLLILMSLKIILST